MVAGLAVEAVMGVGDGPEDGLGGGVFEGDPGAVGLVVVVAEDDVGGLGGVGEVVVVPGGEGGAEAFEVAKGVGVGIGFGVGGGVVLEIDGFGVEDLRGDGRGELDEGFEGRTEGVASNKLAGGRCGERRRGC